MKEAFVHSDETSDHLCGVTIKETGFYGFFWTNRPNDEISETPPAPARCTLRLEFPGETTEQSQQSASARVQMSLPFVDPQGNPLNDVHVGKVLRIQRGTRVLVTSHVGDTEALHADWKLSFRSRLDEGSTLEKANTKDAIQGNVRKTLLCAHCTRSFVKLSDAHCHLQTQHAIRSGESTRSHGFSQDPLSSLLWTRPLEVVYDDDFLAVVIKPQGMPVMGASPSLVRSDLLLPLKPREYATKSDRTFSWRDGTVDLLLTKPRPVHRLDSATGGLLVVAKTRRSEAFLKSALAARACCKTYIAIVIGRMKSLESVEGMKANLEGAEMSQSGAKVQSHWEHWRRFDFPLSGKASVTQYRIKKYVPSLFFGWLTVVELRPITGRKHQLRRHLQCLGHPIVGDRRYGFGAHSLCRHGVDATTSISQTPPGDKLVSNCTSERTISTGLAPLSHPGGPYSRLCLWSMAIEFQHPDSQQTVQCRMEDPQWCCHVVEFETQEWETATHGRRSTQADVLGDRPASIPS